MKDKQSPLAAKDYILLEEYKVCFQEYAYRDKMSVTLFTVIISVMSFFMIHLLSSTVAGEDPGFWGRLIAMIIGFMLIFILHLDLMKVLSCKKAMHKRAQEIEDHFNENHNDHDEHGVLQVKKAISGRDRFKLEYLSHNEFSVGGSMLVATRIFALIWLAYFSDVFVKIVHMASNLSSMSN